MPRILWLADTARQTGYPVTEVEGWQTRGSSTFNPQGLVWHHTAGPASGDMPSLNILINGRSGLPGPLAQYGLGRSGRIYIVAAGRGNHAGEGDWNGLTGNISVIGIEAEHTGSTSEPWPAVQLDAYRKLSARILDRLRTSTDFMCGHKEWARNRTVNRKVDPISLNMATERERVAQLMEDAMPTAREIADEVWLRTTIPNPEVAGTRTHMSDALKRTWAYARKAAIDAAVARAVAEQIAGDEPSVNLDPVTIAELSAQVVAAVDAELAELFADELAERLAD